MSPLALGRRVLPLAAATMLAAGVYAASSPSVAGASTEMRCDNADGITLCHEGFEIQLFERYTDGRISGRVRLADGWRSFTAQLPRTTNIKAVVVLIGANEYG
jgi:hypothetical protein